MEAALLIIQLEESKKIISKFWLDVPIEELIKRLSKSKQRPLLYKKNISETVKKFILIGKKFIMKPIIE